jgi:hypothetical protein
MTPPAPLCDKSVLEAVLSELRPRLRDSAVDLLQQVRDKTLSRRPANDLLEHYLPAGPGMQSGGDE